MSTAYSAILTLLSIRQHRSFLRFEPTQTVFVRGDVRFYFREQFLFLINFHSYRGLLRQFYACLDLVYLGNAMFPFLLQNCDAAFFEVTPQ